MTDRRQLTTPGHAGHLARFLSEECGAARHDKLFLIAGGGIVVALSVFLWASDGLDQTADGAHPAASVPAAKMVSSAPLRATDPLPSEGAEGSESRVFVAADYSQWDSRGHDREAQLLEDELARTRQAEAAAASGEAASGEAEVVPVVAEEPGDS